eukprot:1158862-Pelagomonas_calceolata.AAC.7
MAKKGSPGEFAPGADVKRMVVSRWKSKWKWPTLAQSVPHRVFNMIPRRATLKLFTRLASAASPLKAVVSAAASLGRGFILKV